MAYNTVAGGMPVAAPGAQPQQAPSQAPMFQAQPPVSQYQRLAALMSGAGQQAPSGGLLGGGMSMADMMNMYRQHQAQQGATGLLGGATPGAPNWVNQARFGMSSAQGVNPWSYGMGGQPGGQPGMTAPTDTAGNYQV